MPDTLAQKIRAKYPGTYDQLSDQELEAKVLAKYPGVYDSVPKTPPAAPRTWAGTALETAKGYAKGAARTIANVEELPLMIPGMASAVDAIAGEPISEKLQAHTQAIRKENESTNTPQMVGGALEGLTELAIPVVKGAKAVPSTARAGRAFQDVMGAAKHVAVDVNAPGQVALRINELAERGGSMPMAVRKFLARVTDPNKGAFTYEEARDFASNISRLSANEYQRLTPAIAREVSTLRVTLNKAVGDAAAKAGKGREYAQAMTEYARAMRVRGAIEDVIEGAKRSAPYATAAGAGYWLTSKLRGLLGE